MAIRIEQLRQAAQRSVWQRTIGQSYRTIYEACNAGMRTAFLCHSHADQDLVRGIVQMLTESGWQVYVDWMDASMPAKPNRITAKKIKDRIVQADWFLFLATSNSMSSRWCPWEIGYADGTKPIDQIIVIPTEDSYSTYGSEYLDLYRRINWTEGGKLAVFNPTESQGIIMEHLHI